MAAFLGKGESTHFKKLLRDRLRILSNGEYTYGDKVIVQEVMDLLNEHYTVVWTDRSKKYSTNIKDK